MFYTMVCSLATLQSGPTACVDPVGVLMVRTTVPVNSPIFARALRPERLRTDAARHIQISNGEQPVGEIHFPGHAPRAEQKRAEWYDDVIICGFPTPAGDLVLNIKTDDLSLEATERIHIQVVPDIEQVLRPAVSDTISRAMSSATVGLCRGGTEVELPSGTKLTAYHVWIDIPQIDPLVPTLALRLDFVRNNETVTSLHCWNVQWWRELAAYSPGTGVPGLPSRLSPLVSNNPVFGEILKSPESWVVRVSGDPGVALRNPLASEYWSGSATCRIVVLQ